MQDPVSYYWRCRLKKLQEALQKNNFEVYLADSAEAAKSLALETLIPAAAPATISFGGSATFVKTGLYQAMREESRYQVIDTYDKNIPFEELVERRRQALLVDLFMTGTNAITEQGHLVNLDMIGNRVAGITFGPKKVIVFVGRNKLVADLEAAEVRIKEYAAPTNAIRLDMETPCTKTGFCQDCKSPKRICNHWAITEKCFPPKRITVVLINQDLGL
jgi:L-lactate utilization protein LutB